MTPYEAEKIISNFDLYSSKEREEYKPMFEEACHYLIEDEGNMDAALELGGYYYEEREYDLAYKYYSLAAEHNMPYAFIGLGYIWYYGRLGERNYEKAFKSYARALELLSGKSITDGEFWDLDSEIELNDLQEYDMYINAAYKLADMYRSGYYVKKSYMQYEILIIRIYSMITDSKNAEISDNLLPEVGLRMAEIIIEKGSDNWAEEAFEILNDAKCSLMARLIGSHFFGNFSVMKSIVLKIHSFADILMRVRC